MQSLLSEMIISYQELNGESIEELGEDPSPLEFMRYVAQNRPFVIRNAVREWPATQKWTVDYLQKKLNGQTVQVAVTPDGKADSLVNDPSTGTSYFVKPFEHQVSFEELISGLQTQERGKETNVVWYAQTQNDNLRSEYANILEDVPNDIDWARIALKQVPDAINVWFGNSRSSTSLHRDPYQNLYCQIIGRKHFLLIPPSETPCVNEKLLPVASYRPLVIEGKNPTNVSTKQLQLEPDDGTSPIPCPTWDPDDAFIGRNRFSVLCRPMHVDLNPGDMLNLVSSHPVFPCSAAALYFVSTYNVVRVWTDIPKVSLKWIDRYHKVKQTVGSEGICCAVNYWYDMDFGGSFYSWSNFVRQASLACTGDEDDS